MRIRSTSLVLVLALGCSDGEHVDPVETPATSPNAPPVATTPPAPSLPPEPPSPPPLGTCVGEPGRVLRTLVVGNSQIYYQNLPDILRRLSESAPPACPRLATEAFTRGGQNLERLWNDGDSLGRDLATTIRDGRYDVVVISECIDLVDFPPPVGKFDVYARIIIDAVRASGARPVLYATPFVDKEDHYGFVEMAAPQLALGRELGVTVAAGGLAWLRVWEVLPNVKLHHEDNSHPGYKGSLVSAMVIYGAITRATPVGLATPPIDCQGTPCPEIPKEEVDVFQRAAWEEVKATGLHP